LRAAIGDGSIESLVEWRAVSAGEVIFVPAGTIHAIGAGLVIAEIQQRSDATFRLFDYGRQRELHIESALAVADPGPAVFPVQPGRITDEQTMLVSSPYFGFEKVVLPQNSAWRLQSEQETWLLVINGSARAGPLDLSIGDTIFMQSDRIDIRAGDDGMAALVAYAGCGRIPHLLQRIEQPDATDVERLRKLQATAAPTNGRTAK
jgi:mannose-6-phosphate isomerase